MPDQPPSKPPQWCVGGSGNCWYVLDSPITTDSENRIARCSSQEIAEQIVRDHNARLLPSKPDALCEAICEEIETEARNIQQDSSGHDFSMGMDRWYAENVELKEKP